MNYYGSEGFYFKTSGYSLVCYTAVFSVVTQRSSPLSGEWSELSCTALASKQALHLGDIVKSRRTTVTREET